MSNLAAQTNPVFTILFIIERDGVIRLGHRARWKLRIGTELKTPN